MRDLGNSHDELLDVDRHDRIDRRSSDQHPDRPPVAARRPHNCRLVARSFRELIASRQVSGETPFEGDQMPKFSAKPHEFKCPACKGTGFSAVKQPAKPGRKIYPARCERCDGKGWVEATN